MWLTQLYNRGDKVSAIIKENQRPINCYNRIFRHNYDTHDSTVKNMNPCGT